MRIRKSSRRRARPAPRLLPLDAYPAALDEQACDRIDEALREQLPTIPVEPDDYLDGEGERWTLCADGSWVDHHGQPRSSKYTPMVSLFGPFTRVQQTTSEPKAPDRG